MALHEAIMGAVADLASIAINVIVKKFGYSEVKAKKIETYIFWFVFCLLPRFCALLHSNIVKGSMVRLGAV